MSLDDKTQTESLFQLDFLIQRILVSVGLNAILASLMPENDRHRVQLRTDMPGRSWTIEGIKTHDGGTRMYARRSRSDLHVLCGS